MLLSRFFSQLTAKTLRKTNINQLRHDIVQVLCKFEMIFPPAFFTSMIHVMVHLPEEALLAGPVHYRWMYPIERAKPEGSIIEAWVQYESLTFCGMYLKDVDTAFNRPQRNNDGGLRNEKLSVFAQSARPFGDPVRGESFSRNDMEVAHWFVLKNCDEIMSYLDEHEEIMKREHPSHLYAKKHRDLFPKWFLESVNKLKSSNSPYYSEELYNLAFGPIRAELFSGFHVNGVKFLGTARDDKLCAQNSGVHVPGGGESTNVDFYGKLTTIVQLLYKDRYQVIMFKCRWFDTNPNRQGSVKIDHGFLSVNINRTWYDDDPYILANMARQIVYLDDPKAGSGWKVAQQMDQRIVYAIPELDPTDNDVDNVTDQWLDSSMETDAETLRDTDVIQEPFQLQGVSSIEIPIQSITIDLGDLPCYEVPVGSNNESGEEEDWETETDDSDDNKICATHCVLRRARSEKFSEKSRQPPFFLTSSFCPKHPLFLPSPQPSASPEKGPRRHHSRSPEVPPPSPSKIPPEKASFDMFRPLDRTQTHDRVGFDGLWIGVPDTPKSQTLALMVELPGVSQAPASSTSSVAQPVSARRRHRPASTTDTTSTDGTVASGSQLAKNNTRGPCRQLKTAKVTRVTSAIRLHRQWSCIAPWPTTLATSFGPIARCAGSLGRSCLTRSRWRFAASCRYVSYLVIIFPRDRRLW
ncbi:unnamed protein product [Prunus brigantina]